jgi:hypothetical protein
VAATLVWQNLIRRAPHAFGLGLGDQPSGCRARRRSAILALRAISRSECVGHWGSGRLSGFQTKAVAGAGILA